MVDGQIKALCKAVGRHRVFVLPRSKAQKLGTESIKALERRTSRWLMAEVTGREAVESEQGYPIWPDHGRGSLTHKEGHIVFWYTVEGSGTECGIDLERCQELSNGVSAKILSPLEINLIQDTRDHLGAKYVTALMFSAKESIYKCLYPRVMRRFYFDAVELVDLVWAGGDDVVMIFETRSPIADEVPERSRVYVDGTVMLLDGESYWLTVAYFHAQSFM